MTQISTSAREAAERSFAAWFEANYPGPRTIISDPQWHAPKIFAAVERAIFAHQRYSEGKGEAGEWPVKPNGWLIIEDHSEDGSWSGHAYSYDPRGSSINAEGARPVWLTPPAPKDERALKLERIALAAARWRDAWASQDTSDAEPARKEMLAALRAFEGGDHG